MQVKLKWIGDGTRYIPMIATRDLTDYDLETYSLRDDIEIDTLTEQLIQGGLYKTHEEHKCNECGRDCKSAKALIKHELQHKPKEEKQEGKLL